MSTNLNAEQLPLEIQSAVREAADGLEALDARTRRVRDVMVEEKWSMEGVDVASARVQEAKDKLLAAAEEIGAAEIVRQAYLRNAHVGNKRTVTG